VISNHVHLVLHVDVLKAQGWSDKQVVSSWQTVYKGTLLTPKFKRDETLSQGELISLNETIEIQRKRLYDISWLMRNLNEYIAREANKEDNGSGRFYSLPSMALTLRAS
jgi:hypothetical protein